MGTLVADAQTKRAIARWLTRLAGVTRQRDDDPVDADRLNDYSELLSLDLPSGAFTTASLHAAADGHEWFPAYEAIRLRVRVWWDANKPASAPALTQDRPAGLSEAAASWAAFYHRRRAEIASVEGPLTLDPDPERRVQSRIGNLDSLVKRYSPEAWAHVQRAERGPPPEIYQQELRERWGD